MAALLPRVADCLDDGRDELADALSAAVDARVGRAADLAVNLVATPGDSEVYRDQQDGDDDTDQERDDREAAV